MPTRSPCRVEQLCFLLRREPTVRMVGNLEIRSSLSLQKSEIPSYCISSLHPARFLTFQIMEKMNTSFYFVFISLTFQIITLMSPFCLDFDTWYNLGHSSHPLSTHATCVTWVHLLGDCCHITCLSRAILRLSIPVASKNVKFLLSRNSTKFNVLARFCETILTVKSILSSKI